MLSLRFIARFCTGNKPAEYLKKYQELQQTLTSQQKNIKQLQKKVKQAQEYNKNRNKQIHQMRVKLTKDMQRGDQIWAVAKKKSQANKSQSIRDFAKSMIDLGQHIKNIQKLQTQNHPIELRQGFDITSRMFSNSLNKYKIISYQPKVGDKLDKNKMKVVSERKIQKQGQIKDTVAHVNKIGWDVQGKVLKPAQVIIFK